MPGPSVSPSSFQSRSCSCRLQHWALLSVSLLNCLLSTACSVGLALAIALTVHSRGTHLVRGCNSSALPLDARAAIATNDCPFNTTRIYVSLQGTAHPTAHIGLFLSLFLSSSFLLSLSLLLSFCLPLLLSPAATQSLLSAFRQPGAVPTFRCPPALQDTALALWIPSLLLAAAEAVLSGRSCLVALVFRGIGPCAHGYGTQQVCLGELDRSPSIYKVCAAFVLHLEGAGFCWEQEGCARVGGGC